MEQFWRHGYAATSLDDLLEAMGIARSSFYQAFGSKQGVLLAAIDLYARCEAERMVRILDRPSAEEALRALFAGAMAAECRVRGCFLGNCAIELAPHDPLVAERVRAAYLRLAGRIEARLARAQVEGEISCRFSPRRLAHGVIGVMNGLRVLAKADLGAEVLESVVDTWMHGLWPQEGHHASGKDAGSGCFGPQSP